MQIRRSAKIKQSGFLHKSGGVQKLSEAFFCLIRRSAKIGSGSNQLIRGCLLSERKSARIDIIIEKVKKTNQNPGRDDIISRFDPLSKN